MKSFKYLLAKVPHDFQKKDYLVFYDECILTLLKNLVGHFSKLHSTIQLYAKRMHTFAKGSTTLAKRVAYVRVQGNQTLAKRVTYVCVKGTTFPRTSPDFLSPHFLPLPPLR